MAECLPIASRICSHSISSSPSFPFPPLLVFQEREGYIHPHVSSITLMSLSGPCSFYFAEKQSATQILSLGISERCHLGKVFVANTSCLLGISVEVWGRLFQMKRRVTILKSSPRTWTCLVCVGQTVRFLPSLPGRQEVGTYKGSQGELPHCTRRAAPSPRDALHSALSTLILNI